MREHVLIVSRRTKFNEETFPRRKLTDNTIDIYGDDQASVQSTITSSQWFRANRRMISQRDQTDDDTDRMEHDAQNERRADDTQKPNAVEHWSNTGVISLHEKSSRNFSALQNPKP